MGNMDTSVYGDNDYDIDQPLRMRSGGDNSIVPATGLTVTAWLSASIGGPPIHADLVVVLSENPVASGVYVGIIPKASILLRMFSGGFNYDRQPCWLVFSDATGGLGLSRPRTAYRYRTS